MCSKTVTGWQKIKEKSVDVKQIFIVLYDYDAIAKGTTCMLSDFFSAIHKS